MKYEQDPQGGHVGEAGPDLLARDHPFLAVAFGSGGEPGQVGSGPRLTEELAPDLLGRQQREEISLLLFLGAGMDQRRPGPADPDLIGRSTHAGTAHLIIYD
jgi:hypothetical protein